MVAVRVYDDDNQLIGVEHVSGEQLLEWMPATRESLKDVDKLDAWLRARLQGSDVPAPIDLLPDDLKSLDAIYSQMAAGPDSL